MFHMFSEFFLTSLTTVIPSKATLFNLKCEPIYEFGTGARNSVYYNPQGTDILFAINLSIFLFCIAIFCGITVIILQT